MANKCCPLPHISRALADSTNKEDKKLGARLAGFSYLYTMIWVGTQMGLFVFLFIVFLMSVKNPYMKDYDCCDSVVYLTRTSSDLPFQECPTASCMLYDFEHGGEGYNLGDDRPRDPKAGEYSKIFSNNAQTVCVDGVFPLHYTLCTCQCG